MSVQTLTAPTVASSPYTISHNLGTTNVLVQMYDAVTQRQVQAQVAALNTNQIQVSVATNMPNNVNVIIMGATASPVPLFPADLATKAYVDSRTPNLPGVITSGSGLQSYTDPTGEVFVAQNGIAGGAWKRARDVLYCHVNLSTALAGNTGQVALNFDTASRDVYGMWNGSNGITALISGMYRYELQATCAFGAATGTMAIWGWLGPTQLFYNTQTGTGGFGGTSVSPFATKTFFVPTAGSLVNAQFRQTTAVNVSAGSPWTWASLMYLGSA
jgi:hypothetical protein